MLKAKKEELQERGYKGFTLMEMLIVVAIIAILVAIAIPVFTKQLDAAKVATVTSNCRSAYATYMADEMTKPKPNPTLADAKAAVLKVDKGECSVTVGDDGTVEVSKGEAKDSFQIKF